MNKTQLIAELIRDEGIRLTPYKCTAGKLTIGVGLNLDDGITKDEAIWLLDNRIKMAESDLDRNIPWWRKLSDARRRALINMVYNLGWPRLSEFKKMLRAMEIGNFKAAAREASDSVWAKQVGDRAKRIAALIEKG